MKTAKGKNEEKTEKKTDNEDEIFDPLSFKPSQIEPLDIIDLDKEES